MSVGIFKTERPTRTAGQIFKLHSLGECLFSHAMVLCFFFLFFLFIYFFFVVCFISFYILCTGYSTSERIHIFEKKKKNPPKNSNNVYFIDELVIFIDILYRYMYIESIPM